MPVQRKHTYRVAALNLAEERARRLWLTTLTIVLFGYYFFAELWPALFGAGSG